MAGLFLDFCSHAPTKPPPAGLHFGAILAASSEPPLAFLAGGFSVRPAMTAQDPKSRLPYVYTWLAMAAFIAALIYLFHLI
jgi:cytochrome oxidase assembly protein ShyY1